jgi:transcriptional regulator with XRE-family HTH domain
MAAVLCTRRRIDECAAAAAVLDSLTEWVDPLLTFEVIARPPDSEDKQIMITADAAIAEPASSFGGMLREWRRARGASQLELSLTCGLSQKHLSFLESGRSRPSRGMVLHLASALGVPLRQQNAMLLAAGFAPVYQERSLTSAEMRPIDRAFSYVLQQQEPFPALVVDRAYNMLRANRAMEALLSFLTDGAGLPGDLPVNTAELVLRPDRLRPFLENWEEVGGWLLRHLRAESMLEGAGERVFSSLLQRLRALPGVAELERTLRNDHDLPPALVSHLRKGDTRLALFSVNAALGTPLDVTLQSVQLELFFPADEATEKWFRERSEEVKK